LGGLIDDNQENRQRCRNRAIQASEGSTKREEGAVVETINMPKKSPPPKKGK
jgi:hypothetical protein